MDHHDFKISIIIPVYNRDNIIRKCLDSIAKQSLDQNLFEVIVVDDCSTDNSVENVRNYTKIKNLRTILLDRNSGGASKPRNIGIESAKGKYIVFIDSDDTITENALEIALNLAQENDLDMVLIPIQFEKGKKGYTNLFNEYPEGIIRENLQNNKKLGGLIFSNPGVVGRLYKRKNIITSGIRFSEKLRVYEDTLFSRFTFAITNTVGIVPIETGAYVPTPPQNENNLSLLRRTTSRCVTYVAEALRICSEIPNSIISHNKKIRILNNTLCRNNIYDTLNNSTGYEALIPHLDDLHPLMCDKNIREKAKGLIRNVSLTKSLQEQSERAKNFFELGQGYYSLGTNYKKIWIWEGTTLVIDFEFYNYQVGIDISKDIGGYRFVEMVLRGKTRELKSNWEILGRKHANRVFLFSHPSIRSFDEALAKIETALLETKKLLMKEIEIKNDKHP